jgi:hypothetical protein
MSTNPSSLALQQPSQKPSLKAPLILLALLFLAGNLGLRWIHSRATASNPIFHQTKSGWQQMPSPGGLPERLRVSSNGTVWVLIWGRTALSRWDGSTWHYYKDTDFGSKTTYSDCDFALDGEQVWAPAGQGILHWDGQRWESNREVPVSRGASIVAGDGQVWVVDDTLKLHHFEKGKWTSEKHVLPGVNPEQVKEGGNPELARTADGTVWLVGRSVWRRDGANWVAVTADGQPLEDATLIGTTGDRLWLSDVSGLRAVSKDASAQGVYQTAQTGIAEEVTVNDVASDGKLTWFATSAGLTEFDGSHWRQRPRPSEKVPGIHAVASAPDGTLWAIGATPGGLFRNMGYLVPLLFVLPLGLLGASLWFFQRIRRRQLQQHQRVTQAVQHATGEVPAELEIGERRLASSGFVWAFLIFGSGVGFYLLRKVWPNAPYWMVPVLFVSIHLAITFQQSLVKRRPKASDPIGPGAPSQYDWGKTLKSVAGAVLFILFFNANRFPALLFLRGYTFWAGLVIVVGYKGLGLRLMNQATRRGDYDGALKIVRWFHFYNPSGSEAMRMSGHILLMAGRYREAEDALRRSFTSSHAAQTYGMALEYLGDTLMELGRYDEATRSFEAALHTFTWLRRPYRGMAELALRRGKDPQQALQYVESIVDFNGLSRIQRQNNGRPQDDYWALKAWALASAGRASEVAVAIENAMQATDPKCLPDLATTHYRAGMAMQALGNVSESNEHFRRAMEFDPHGRRGMLSNAALHQTSVWGKIRESEPRPEGSFAR